MPVELDIRRVAHHESLQFARLRVQARQTHQLALGLFPLRQGINEEALLTIDGHNQFALSLGGDLLPITGRQHHPPLVIQGYFRCTA